MMAYRVPGAISPSVKGAVSAILPPATLAGVGGGILFLFVTGKKKKLVYEDFLVRLFCLMKIVYTSKSLHPRAHT